MRLRTVVISFAFHAGLATFLLSRAETRQAHRSISVAVQDEKKKADKPKPPPPKPIAKVAPKPPPPPKEEAPTPEPAKTAAPSAPTQTAVALSNADLGPGGIALAGTPKAMLPQAKAVKVAQALPDDVRKHLNDSGKQAEPECEEEPTKPEPVFKTEIEYTASAREQGIEGRMKLKITVGADGSVTDVEVETGLDASLDAAAVAAVKQWRFKPALRCGKPVAGGVYRVAQRFELAN